MHFLKLVGFVSTALGHLYHGEHARFVNAGNINGNSAAMRDLT